MSFCIYIFFVFLYIFINYFVFFYKIGHFNSIDNVKDAKIILLSDVINNKFFRIQYLFDANEKYSLCMRYVLLYNDVLLGIEFFNTFNVNNIGNFTMEQLLNEIDLLNLEIKNMENISRRLAEKLDKPISMKFLFGNFLSKFV